MTRKSIKRHIVALGASAALLTAGGAAALANGSHSAPASNAATQSATNSQVLPISLGLGLAAPVNANAPVSALSGGSGRGDVEQRNSAAATGQAKNAETMQSVRQEAGRDGGTNAAGQSASNTQVLPVAIGGGAAVPVNANVPVSALSGGSDGGDVRQENGSTVSGRAVNVEHDQDVVQRAGKGARNSAGQSASNTQVLPIALGLGLAVPVNANVPVAVLSSGADRGAVTQRNDGDARAEALNNETEQTIRQSGSAKGTKNTATQAADSSQLLALALGPALAVPANADVPVALLSATGDDGDVAQRAGADAGAESINNETDQTVSQDDAQEAVSRMLANVARSMTEASAAR